MMERKPIRIAGITAQSVVDGPGLRLTVFTQGCPHRCPGCHNPETHDFAGGSDTTVEALLKELDKNPLLSGITLSGGEPLCQAAALLPLAEEAVRRGKDIVVYSGYTFEELQTMMAQDFAAAALLRLTRLLVDGRFVLAERDLTLRFRGSRNQRVLDMQASLAANAPVWAEGYGGPNG